MITIAGVSPSLDLTYQVDDLVLGQISRSSLVVRCAGGKPLNLARAAATLGAKVSVVAILGGPTGDLLASTLRSAGIEVAVMPTPHETRTCVSIASAATGELTEVYQNAAEIPDSVWSAFRHELADVLERRPGWLVVNGGAPAGLDPTALASLVDLAHDHGCRVAVDTYGPSLAAAVDVRPDIVKVNRAEAAGLLDAPPDADLVEMAVAMQRQTGEVVVLTDGVRGVALVAEGLQLRADLPGVSGPYAVGSGDSFLGGLIAELDRDADLRSALATATAAGMANALTPGSANFRRADVDRLRPQVRICVAGV